MEKNYITISNSGQELILKMFANGNKIDLRTSKMSWRTWKRISEFLLNIGLIYQICDKCDRRIEKGFCFKCRKNIEEKVYALTLQGEIFGLWLKEIQGKIA